MTSNTVSTLKLMAVLVTALFFTPQVHAAYNPNNPWVKNPNGPGYTRNLNQGATAGMRSASMHGPGGYTIIETPNGSSVPITRTVPINVPVQPSPVSVPVKDTIHVPKAAIARAGAKYAMKAIPLIGAGITAWEIYEGLTDDGISYDPESGELVKEDGDGGVWISRGPDTWLATGACDAGVRMEDPPAYNFQGQDCFVGGSQQNADGSTTQWEKPVPSRYTEINGGKRYTLSTKQTITYPSQFQIPPNIQDIDVGYISIEDACLGSQPPQGCGEGTKRPPTEEEIYEAFVAQGMAEMADLLNQMKAGGEPVSVPSDTPGSLTPESPTVNGQPLTTTTTKVGADGQTETLTRVDQQTATATSTGSNISNQTITYNIANTYTITNSSGLVVEQSQIEQPPLPEPEDDSFTDPAFPPIPELYEQKYENGLVGVWNAKKGELMNTPMIQGVRNMFPNFDGGGTCPNWGLTFNFGTNMNFGTHYFNIPCSLWTTLGLILLTTACFVAWRIVFGR